ncbi:MAG: ATP-binding protein [Pseudomonadota bacterium]
MFGRLLERYERFLKIDRDGPTGTLVRARSVYAFGWAFVLIQTANLVTMTSTFGGWSRYHMISLCTMLAVLAAVHSIRYFQSFIFFSVMTFVVLLGGVAATAGPSGSGVNTSVVFYVIITPIIAGFISGWRMALIGCVFSVTLIWHLTWISNYAPGVGFEMDPVRNIERAWQATYALVLATVVGCAFAASIFLAFEKLERTAERARKAEQAKTQFLANMSHELRTPLNGVLGLTQSLHATPLNADQRHLLTTIEKSGDSLLAILNDILDLSKIDAGRVELTDSPFCLRKLVGDIGDVWRETAREKGLLLDLAVDDAVPARLLGDDVRIRQVITNLVSNALKFTEKGGVTVSAYRDDGDVTSSVVIAVSDTGPGLPPESLAKIFQPFEQGDPDTTRKFGGTGLGLSICRNLAHIMGGDIDIRSEVGRGSTFEFRFPLLAADAPASPLDAETPEAPASLEGLKILIVEDNQVNQMVVERLLEGLGASYDTANNGEEAIVRLTAEGAAYDAVLMDKHMPILDGVDATRRLRAMEGAFATLPIIACTADAMNGEREQLLDTGFTDFIAKPIRQEMLARIVSAAVNQATADAAVQKKSQAAETTGDADGDRRRLMSA